MMNNQKKTPLFLKIKSFILDKIEQQEYLPGQALPSERKMAESLDVSRMTVRKAVLELVDEGILRQVHGKGTFVNIEMKDKDIYEATTGIGMSAMFKKRGIHREDKVLVHGAIQSQNYLANKLSLLSNEEVVALHRVRYGDHEPFAVEYSYAPFKYFSDILNYDFSTVSLYKYMENKDRLPIKFNQKMTVVPAGDKLAKYLKITSEDYLYYFEYIGYDKNNVPVEYTESFVRVDKSEFIYEAQGAIK